MKIYLVGGAVRNLLLNLPVSDRDFVVVGGSPQIMNKLGFIQVAKSFPVFLHPVTKEEYALARTENKCGVGYKGFVTHYGADVSLEQDLLRRDITINAIAIDEYGNIIDPYNGAHALQNKVLCHVSAAFGEDPLRVLRVARFYSQLAHLGFKIAKSTQLLMRNIVQSKELQTISAERIYMEISKVFSNAHEPHLFFITLKNLNVYSNIMTFLHDYDEKNFILLTKMKACKANVHELMITIAFKMQLNTGIAFLDSIKVPSVIKKLFLCIKKNFLALSTWQILSYEEIYLLFRELKKFKLKNEFLVLNYLHKLYSAYNLNCNKLILLIELFQLLHSVKITLPNSVKLVEEEFFKDTYCKVIRDFMLNIL
jgi:tRNA nucleotidyltransferase/poly(A) polymerase